MSSLPVINVQPDWSSIPPACRVKVRALLEAQLVSAEGAVPPDPDLVLGLRAALASLDRQIDPPPIGG